MSRLTTVLFVGALLAAAVVFGYFYIFSRSMSLDEGFLMITIKGFVSGHPLYDSVFTQYGPFYYCYEWLLRSVLQIPLTHDATRLLCIGHWLVAAVLMGWTARRITGSVFAGLFVAAQAFAHLAAVAHEPGHPQEVVVVLVALALLASTWAQQRWAFAVIGVVGACLAFTKINVGVFFAWAMLLTVCTAVRLPKALRVLPVILGGACVALPFLLVRKHAHVTWCQNFAIEVALAALAVFYVVYKSSQKSVQVSHSEAANEVPVLRNVISASIGFAGVAAVLVAVTLATGTSVRGLVDGLLLTPLKMPGMAMLVLETGLGSILSAAASLVGAVLLMRLHPGDRRAGWILGLKLVFAFVGALLLVGDAKDQLRYMLPWIWLIAIPSGNGASKRETFARSFVALAGTWQALQVYPVAGTQVTIATAAMVVAYGVCLSDAFKMLALRPDFARRIAAMPMRTRRLYTAGGAAVVLFLFGGVWCNISAARREYAQLPPIKLPGSSLVHMDLETVLTYGALSRYLSEQADTFVTYPGVNSLYLWTGKPTPTQLNCNGWGQLSHAQQQQILSAVASGRRPKIVVVESTTESWHQPMYDPIRPLVRFVTEECRPVQRIGTFMVYEPKRLARNP